MLDKMLLLLLLLLKFTNPIRESIQDQSILGMIKCDVCYHFLGHERAIAIMHRRDNMAT